MLMKTRRIEIPLFQIVLQYGESKLTNRITLYHAQPSKQSFVNGCDGSMCFPYVGEQSGKELLEVIDINSNLVMKCTVDPSNNNRTAS